MIDEEIRWQFKEWFEPLKTKARFIRMIRTDKVLAEQIAWEAFKRGLKIGQRANQRSARND